MKNPSPEEFARKTTLPVVVDPVARELYGTLIPVLDERRVEEMLAVTDYSPASKALIRQRFQERVDSLSPERQKI
jgi:hypothetical protein